jgi:ABC-type glycerol-3-phosphate transport system substrate-binding protein
MIKKWIGGFVAVAVLGLGAALAQATTLTFLRFDSSVHNVYLDPIIAAFEKANPDIKIQSVGLATGGYEGMAEKALLTAASGTPYDLVQTGYSLLRTMVESGNALPVEKYLRFLRFLTEEEPARFVAENTGYTPGNMSVWSEMKRKYSSDNNQQVILNQVTRVSPWYSWVGGKGPQISKILKDMQHAVLLGRAEPKAAADDAAKQVQELIKK